jgi:hypothetical protein
MIASKCGMTEDELLADWLAVIERQRVRRQRAIVQAGRVGNGFMGRSTFTGTRARAGYATK